VVVAFGAGAEPARAQTAGSQASQASQASQDTPPVPPPKALPKALPALVETIAQTDDLKRLGNALDAAGLKDALNSSPGPYTVFVPNKAAFAAFDAATPTKLAELQKPENKAQLSALVTYHIIKGTYTIEQLKQEATAAGPAGKTYATLTGLPVTLSYDPGNHILAINGVPIVESDIVASNGIIHPVGQVLTPLPTANPAPIPDRPVTRRTPVGILIVRVRSAEDGRGIANVAVRTDSETERPFYGLTGPDGVARLVLPPGTYTVILNGSAAGYETRAGINPATNRPYTRRGYEGSRANVVIAAGQPITLDCGPARPIGATK
jgi:uncharacterized surface protein with fasciclin (FAS1) repeats